MAVASALFALMAVFAKEASAHARWVDVAFVRSAVGFLVALLVARLRGAAILPTQRRKSWIRALAGTAAMIATFYAYASPALRLGDAAALGAVSTVFIALGGTFVLGEPAPRRLWPALALAVLGVFAISPPGPGLGSAVAGIALLGALFSAIAKVTIRNLGPTESPESVAIHFALVSTVAMGAIGAALPLGLFGAAPVAPGPWPPTAAALPLALTGLTGGFAQLAMTRAYALDHAGRVAILGHLSLVFTQLFAFAILGEVPTLRAALGAALVLTSSVVLSLGGSHQDAPGGRGRRVVRVDDREQEDGRAAVVQHREG